MSDVVIGYEDRISTLEVEVAEIIGDASSTGTSLKELAERMDAAEDSIISLEIAHVIDISALSGRIDDVVADVSSLASDVDAVAGELAVCVDDVADNSSRIARLEFDMYDSSGEIMQDMSNIAANFVSVDSSIETLRSDVSSLEDGVETLTVYTENAVETLDSSVAQLYEMFHMMSKRLGIDKIKIPIFDILPEIMQKIQDIYDKELEWRILDSSEGEHGNYEKNWRLLNDDDDSLTDDSYVVDEPSDEQDTEVVDSGEDNTEGDEEHTEGAFRAFWRNLGIH